MVEEVAICDPEVEKAGQQLVGSPPGRVILHCKPHQAAGGWTRLGALPFERRDALLIKRFRVQPSDTGGSLKFSLE
jgi:hypothetical protein